MPTEEPGLTLDLDDLEWDPEEERTKEYDLFTILARLAEPEEFS
jgi:hypothetical protein